MRDILAQLQTGLQAFLQQSMENMLNHLAPAQTNPAPQASTAQPHIVSISPLSLVPAATKSEEPMDATSSTLIPVHKQLPLTCSSENLSKGLGSFSPSQTWPQSNTTNRVQL